VLAPLIHSALLSAQYKPQNLHKAIYRSALKNQLLFFVFAQKGNSLPGEQNKKDNLSTI
jgi:hypothetical protein